MDEEEREEALLEIDGTRLAAQLPQNNWRSVLVRFLISVAFLSLLFWRLPDVSLGDVIPEISSAAVVWVLVAVCL